MRAAALATIAVVACGGSAPPPAVAPAAAGSATVTPRPADLAASPPPPEVTAEQACKRFAELAHAGCASFDKLVPPDDLCPDMMKPILLDAQGHAFAACAVGNASCDQVLACIKDVSANAVKHEPLRACNTTGANPVGIPRDEWARRTGAASKELARVASSKDKPIETCGFDEERLWVEAATCADGSTPGRGKAEMVRIGNVGRGGRCGSIVDHYSVPCPERAYDVFIDPYVCAER